MAGVKIRNKTKGARTITRMSEGGFAFVAFQTLRDVLCLFCDLPEASEFKSRLSVM